MKQTIKRTIIVGAALTLLVSPAAVLAKDGISGGRDDSTAFHTESESPHPSPTGTPRSEHVRELEDQVKEQLGDKQRPEKENGKVKELKEKLDDTKKKACENHVATINSLEQTVNSRRTTVLERINKIAIAVEAFYAKKQLSVANYDDLVAKVDSTKAAAEQAVQQQQQIPSLDCSGDHPHADVQGFKDKRSVSSVALKAYRDAVKALVKAVKAAAGVSESESPSPSVSPVGGNQ